MGEGLCIVFSECSQSWPGICDHSHLLRVWDLGVSGCCVLYFDNSDGMATKASQQQWQKGSSMLCCLCFAAIGAGW
jgi:hypothetical protein